MSKKPYNFDIFQTVFQVCTSRPPKFWGGSEIWSHPPMCILLKLNYAKFGVSNLFFSKGIEEKPLGGRLDPLGTGRIKDVKIIYVGVSWGYYMSHLSAIFFAVSLLLAHI